MKVWRFNVTLVNSVDAGGRLVRFRMEATANPPGQDPVSTADVTFTLIPVNGYRSVGISLSSSSSTLAVDNINNLTFTGTSATIQDDESVVDMINGVGAMPVAFASGSNVDFIVGNWNGSSGFTNAAHRENWSVDVVNGVSTNFTYVSGTPGSLRREPLVWGVEMEPGDPVDPVVDLKITKSVDDPSPNIGDTVTFTLLVENVGVNDASDVAITDIIPSGFSYVCLLYTSPSPRDKRQSRMPSSA